MRKTDKRHTFVSLSRRKRRHKVISLKNLIHRERHRCGGLFYDESDMNQYDDEEPGRIWSWSDIYFTGLDPAVFWNAEIITAQVVLKDEIESLAFEEARRILTAEEREKEFKYETTPNYNAKGKIVSRTVIRPEPTEYAVFGGLTFWQYVKKREQEIARDAPPPVYCRYEILPRFAYGVGLRMIVESSSLSHQVIETAIADFRLRGEHEWCSPEPVSFTDTPVRDGCQSVQSLHCAEK